MTAQIRLRDASGTLRVITRIRMRDAGGILRVIQRVRMRDASNILRTVFAAMTASATTPVSGSASTFAVSTSASTVTVTGGASPYTYNWTVKNNDPATYNPDGLTITTPTASSTTFKKSGMTTGQSFNAIFSCTVTDALGAVVTTNDVYADVTRV